RKLAIGLALLLVCYLAQFTVVVATRKAGPTKFTVRVENISNPEGITASNGMKFPFALSPGMFVLSAKNAPLFTVGKAARANGLEMQAEDGDPSGLVKSLEVMHHASNLHGVFNTPVGAMGAGPIRPGDSYEYSFTATPGMKLFTTMMFGQSNDWFYSPDGGGIALFDAQGYPVSGDVTDKLVLWNAGTEVDEEIGIGSNQGPRQKGPNTGAAENGVVRRVQDARFTGKNAEFFRVTITAEQGM
ncbi:MAG TPA: spondin domain-containing protein, partial [Pyrinomonadaceae bacterium]|nr:spondin domain-containing protein [Pyrinomonadaceae bacterium]